MSFSEGAFKYDIILVYTGHYLTASLFLNVVLAILTVAICWANLLSQFRGNLGFYQDRGKVSEEPRKPHAWMENFCSDVTHSLGKTVEKTDERREFSQIFNKPPK